MTLLRALAQRAVDSAPQETPPAVAVRGLVFQRGKQTVVKVDTLDIRRNDVLAIVGPNGAGKTTLLLCLALLLVPTAGTIAFDGVRAKDMLRQRRRMAVVFQDPLLIDMSVQENIALGLRFRGLDRQTITQRTGYWLERFGIAQLAHRRARELSRGEAQRVSLARAFVTQPEILFLDEPFTNLDGPTHRALIDSLAAVLAETGVTTVIISHDLKDVLHLASKVAVMISGAIRQLGRPRDVFAYPLRDDVQAFLAAHRTGGGLAAP